MNEPFKIGDRVYHKNLETYGIFDSYDWASDDSCFVCFEDEYGHNDDYRCVSLNQLIKVDKKEN